MKIVVGLLERDAGTVERGGKLGYCPQTPLLWEKLTVEEHFELFARAYELDPAEAAALDRARVSLQQADDDLHQGALARAVLADQPDQFAAADLEASSLQNLDSAAPRR